MAVQGFGSVRAAAAETGVNVATILNMKNRKSHLFGAPAVRRMLAWGAAAEAEADALEATGGAGAAAEISDAGGALAPAPVSGGVDGSLSQAQPDRPAAAPPTLALPPATSVAVPLLRLSERLKAEMDRELVFLEAERARLSAELHPIEAEIRRLTEARNVLAAAT
jgi:hypothetical protein